MTSPAMSDVPQPFRGPLRYLSKADSNVFEILLGKFRESRATSMEDLADEIRAALPNEPSAVGGLASAIGSLVASFSDVLEQAPRIASSLSASPALGLSEDQIPVLRERVEALIVSPILAILGKTQRLRFSHERNFEDAEIITDLRPIYGPGDELDIQAMIVWHNLRIRYSGPEESGYLEYAMELQDLESLRTQITRALEKERALRIRLGELAIPTVGNGATDA